jgi:hypothetical protein
MPSSKSLAEIRPPDLARSSIPEYRASYSRGTPTTRVTSPSCKARMIWGPVRAWGMMMGNPAASGVSIPITNG